MANPPERERVINRLFFFRSFFCLSLPPPFRIPRRLVFFSSFHRFDTLRADYRPIPTHSLLNQLRIRIPTYDSTLPDPPNQLSNLQPASLRLALHHRPTVLGYTRRPRQLSVQGQSQNQNRPAANQSCQQHPTASVVPFTSWHLRPQNRTRESITLFASPRHQVLGDATNAPYDPQSSAKTKKRDKAALELSTKNTVFIRRTFHQSFCSSFLLRLRRCFLAPGLSQ